MLRFMIQRKYGGRPPRLGRVQDIGSVPLWFVTFNTNGRKRWLACEPVHQALIMFGKRAILEHDIAVGRYVIMPDHLHLFVAGFNFELGRWVGLLKQALAKAGAPKGARAWQEGFFDHLLRCDESYWQKWEYVRSNPVRENLVKTWDAWPWQGELVEIDRV